MTRRALDCGPSRLQFRIVACITPFAIAATLSPGQASSPGMACRLLIEGSRPSAFHFVSCPKGEILTTYDIAVTSDLEPAFDVWSHLEGDGASTPFQASAWLEPWFRIVAPRMGAEPVLVTVRDGRSLEPLMFLPLCRRMDGGLAIIEFADLGVSDYNAPLISTGFAPSDRELDALWQQMRGVLP